MDYFLIYFKQINLKQKNNLNVRKTIFGTLIFTSLFVCGFGQSSSFNIFLEPFIISGISGVQSFAYGQFEDKWLIVGGRIDGLHKRQPFASFDVAGENKNLLVIAPQTGQFWEAPLLSLPLSIQDQLGSTNMEYFQQDSMLYCVGGYGYNNAAGDHITYNFLTAINVPLVIKAIMNGTDFSSGFRQISDPQFAVTGGSLDKIFDTWYLIGGQKFDGNYNPMNHPTFTQEYTNEIRMFKLTDNGIEINITHLPDITDSENLHRRDLNIIPQIMPNGEEGITAFSGVFQQDVDLPYLNCVNIDSNGYTVNDTFSQYYNHYHCAVLPLYSASENSMHSVFFGGISQFYESGGLLIQDDNVPFVKTIARVTRNGSGLMTEFKMPIEMPDLIGSSAELILVENIPVYNNNVIKFDELTEDTTLIGYIFGGINSTQENIFFTNTGIQSFANTTLYKVYVLKNNAVDIDQLNVRNAGSLQMQVFPNPSNGKFVIKFSLMEKSDVAFVVSDLDGNLIKTQTISAMPPGENRLIYTADNQLKNSIYIITIETPHEKTTQKINLNR